MAWQFSMVIIRHIQQHPVDGRANRVPGQGPRQALQCAAAAYLHSWSTGSMTSPAVAMTSPGFAVFSGTGVAGPSTRVKTSCKLTVDVLSIPNPTGKSGGSWSRKTLYRFWPTLVSRQNPYLSGGLIGFPMAAVRNRIFGAERLMRFSNRSAFAL